MSQREQHAEMQRLADEIQHELDTAPLTLQQRKELEIHAAALAGAFLYPWFPLSWGRRLIMVGIVLFGLQQAWIGNFEGADFLGAVTNVLAAHHGRVRWARSSKCLWQIKHE